MKWKSFSMRGSVVREEGFMDYIPKIILLSVLQLFSLTYSTFDLDRVAPPILPVI